MANITEPREEKEDQFNNVVKFGKGAIMMSTSQLINDKGKKFVRVYFSKVEPGEIGIEIRESERYKIESDLTPFLIFEFDNIKSIESLVYNLKAAHANLLTLTDWEVKNEHI